VRGMVALAEAVRRIELETRERMSEENKPQGGHGKEYTPPKLVRISLRPEEAVLGHCKVSGSAGPASASCTSVFCRTPGS